MTFDRRRFLLSTVAAPILAATRKKISAPPNILVIEARDLGAYMLGCYGNTEIHTPNIDRLARLGVRFSASYAASPVASEANAVIPANTLAAAGYKQSSGADFTPPAPPFLAIVDWPGPLTEAPAKKNLDLYAAVNFETIGRDVATPEQMATIRKYAAGLTTLDERLPALQAKLSQAGVADNTLIIFTSTNGYLLGQHGLWGDGAAAGSVSMYEESVRVPLIWSYPAQFPPQTDSNQVVGASDLAPTLCELTGAPFAGPSYLPFVRGEHLPKKRTWPGIAVAHFHDTAMVRDYRYKLVVRGPDKSAGQLFDIAVDPQEKNNMYDNPQYVSVRERLSSELAARPKANA